MKTLVATAANTFGPSVLLVEDERSIAEPFAQALRRHGFRATIARTGADALRIGGDAPPDIVLLDLGLPDVDGIDLCRRLRRDSQVPIIIVTARGTITDRVVGLELGADDYIVKPFATGEAISRIRAVLRRTRPADLAAERDDVAPRFEREATGVGTAYRDGRANGVRLSSRDSEDADRALEIGELRVDPAARRAFLAGRELQLTRKELDLLMRLMADAGRVLTRETLIAEVWDENWFGSTKTLDVHIASLRRKLGDRPQSPSYIHTVRGVGFRFAAPQEPQA